MSPTSCCRNGSGRHSWNKRRRLGTVLVQDHDWFVVSPLLLVVATDFFNLNLIAESYLVVAHRHRLAGSRHALARHIRASQMVGVAFRTHQRSLGASIDVLNHMVMRTPY